MADFDWQSPVFSAEFPIGQLREKLLAGFGIQKHFGHQSLDDLRSQFLGWGVHRCWLYEFRSSWEVRKYSNDLNWFLNPRQFQFLLFREGHASFAPTAFSQPIISPFGSDCAKSATVILSTHSRLRRRFALLSFSFLVSSVTAFQAGAFASAV